MCGGVPRASSTRPLGSPLLTPGVVLSDPALRVDSEADVDAAFILWVGAVQQVDPTEALHLHNHG